ncbi:hypothetical protein HK097_001074 [Rhizophlyctis rosea]|uniref:Uncharacterized protein n=1 Tax=Rhizophlyctis rosea TaxID=64517 RepID=A0AAD5X270_9FUNG|nr:hypothetical protein HK097_001074 [Rhizophlyctis rosea]
MLGHFFSTQGCYLCTRYPIPDSKVNDRYFRDVAFADPPYRTWAIDTGLDSQYLNDMAEAGLITDILDRWNANGGMVDDEWKNDPWPVNTPANITEKWERRPRIPCLCWGSVIAWHKMDLSIPPESGQDRCTNEFHWQMTSFDCRRVINNSGAGPLADLIVDPNLHCSDGGNSFNSIQIQPVPLPPGSFVPSQEQDPSPPTQPPIATAPPVSTAVDGPAPTDSNGGSVGGGSPPASATSTVAPGQPSTSATPIGGLDIGGGTGIVIGPGTGDGRSPPGGGVIPGGMGGGDSLGLDGSPGDGSPGGRNGNIGAGSAGLSNGKGGPSATTPGVNIPPSPSGTRSIPLLFKNTMVGDIILLQKKKPGVQVWRKACYVIMLKESCEGLSKDVYERAPGFKLDHKKYGFQLRIVT